MNNLKIKSPNKQNKIKPGNRKKNENILCAIIALMKELDKGEIEFVKIDVMKRI